MIRAWRLADGRYALIYGTISGWLEGRELTRRAGIEPAMSEHVVSAFEVERLGAEKVYGVVTGPSSCGCEPAMFRWVGESEVDAGKTVASYCPECRRRGRIGSRLDQNHQCDIIDVCGEADVAQAVYEAEFASKIGALT